MKDNVVELNNITRLDLPADRILDRAKGKLESCVVIGYDNDGDEFFASSIADGGTVLWLIERLKAKLIAVPESEMFQK